MSKVAFLADENFPLKAVEYLREQGVDILSVQEVSPGAKNGEIVRLAVKEKRVLLTFDKDFGEWVYREGAPMGVVLFRMSRFTEDEIALIVLQKLLTAKENLLRSFVVVESDRLRIVPLPR